MRGDVEEFVSDKGASSAGVAAADTSIGARLHIESAKYFMKVWYGVGLFFISFTLAVDNSAEYINFTHPSTQENLPDMELAFKKGFGTTLKISERSVRQKLQLPSLF